MALEQTRVFSQEPDKILARKSVASASEKETVSK